MYTIIDDRIFWIYFIVTIFFIIIGVGLIVMSNDPYVISITMLWLVSNLMLMILVYYTSLRWSPNDIEEQICVIDANSQCFDINNRTWLYVNILFIILLIISTLWAGELGNTDGSPIRTMSGVLVLLGGIILCKLSINDLHKREFICSFPFWVAIGYLIIWLSLTLYVVI